MRRIRTLFAIFRMVSRVEEEALRKLRHDLRSPLVVVAGFAQLLAADRPMEDADRRDYAERILRASQELEQLMDDALSST